MDDPTGGHQWPHRISSENWKVSFLFLRKTKAIFQPRALQTLSVLSDPWWGVLARPFAVPPWVCTALPHRGSHLLSACFPASQESTASPLQRSVSENSLVAMDFSGQTGRVIENPAEAQSAALEEGHAWRVRLWPDPTPGLPQRNGPVLAAGMRCEGGGVAVSSRLQEAVACLGSSTPPAPGHPHGPSLGSHGRRDRSRALKPRGPQPCPC